MVGPEDFRSARLHRVFRAPGPLTKVKKQPPRQNTMTPEHANWRIFAWRLQGPEGCDFRLNAAGEHTWNCDGTKVSVSSNVELRSRYPGAVRVLLAMGHSSAEIDESLEWFMAHGGTCDCEIVFNVDPRTREELLLKRKKRERERRNERRRARRAAASEA